MTHRSAWLAVSLVVALAGLAAPAVAGGGSSGGKIDAARDRVDNDDDDRGSSSSSSSSSDDDDDDDDSSDDSDDDWYSDDDGAGDGDVGEASALMLKIIGYYLGIPWWVPPAIIGDKPFTRERIFQYRDYPFEGGGPGPHEFPSPYMTDRHRPGYIEPRGFDTMMRVQAMYERHADNFDGRRLQWQWRSNYRFNLEGEITRYHEVLSDGTADNFWHYKAMLTYSFGVSPRAHFATGIGFRGTDFGGDVQSKGIIFRYGMELFPFRPVHAWIMGEAGGGDAGGDAEWEAGVGVLIYRFEAFVGYRHFRFVGLDFKGPMGGLMAWF